MAKPEDYTGIRPETVLTERIISTVIPALALAGAVALGVESTGSEREAQTPALNSTVAVMPEEVAVALPALNKIPNTR